VPNRYFYVRWIQNELLPLGHDAAFFAQPKPLVRDGHTIVGLDIGTGAICIYPLLMVSSWSKFQNPLPTRRILMHATEIDPRSVESARTNVGGNSQLREQIHVWQVSASDRQRQRVVWSESGDDADINTVAMDVASSASPQPFDTLFQVGRFMEACNTLSSKCPMLPWCSILPWLTHPFMTWTSFPPFKKKLTTADVAMRRILGMMPIVGATRTMIRW
jgi:RNA methyltransferase